VGLPRFPELRTQDPFFIPDSDQQKRLSGFSRRFRLLPSDVKCHHHGFDGAISQACRLSTTTSAPSLNRQTDTLSARVG